MAITVNSTKTFANYFPEYTADLTTRGVSNFSGDDEILLSCTSTSDSGDSTVIRKVPLSRLTELSSLLATTEHRGFISATEKGSLNMLSLASTEHAGLVPDTNGHLGDNVFLGTNENTGKPQWQTMGNHTASTSASGFLSASDKIKLDNIASSATRNTFSAINYPSTATQTPSFGESFKVWNVGQTTSGAINMATMALTIPNYLASTTSDGSRRGLVPGPTTAQIGDNYFLGTGSSGTPQWQNMSAHQAST